MLTRGRGNVLKQNRTKNQENPETGEAGIARQRLLRSKQQNVTAGVTTTTTATGLARPPVRRALGDIRNNNKQTKQPNQRKEDLPLQVAGAGQKGAAGRKIEKGKPAGRGQTRLAASKNEPKPAPEVVLEKAREEVVDDVSMQSVDNEHQQHPPLPELLQPLCVSEGASAISEDAGELKESVAYSTAMIPNIDEGHEQNPQMLTEYVRGIFDYLRHLEVKHGIKEDHLAGKQVTGKMRSILMDWLVQVHVKFHLLPETLYLTVATIDRFTQKSVKVDKDNFQLVGVTGMFIASKYEEMYSPELGDFVYITDYTYSKKQMLRTEIEMLQALGCEMGRPLPLHFLRRFSKAAEADVTVHSMAKYFMELALIEYGLAHVPPSLLAASALWLALQLLTDKKWTEALIHYTLYTEDQLKENVALISKALVKVHSGKSKLQAVRNKHGTSKYMEVSKNKALGDLNKLQTFC